jgi:hypothetical protein
LRTPCGALSQPAGQHRVDDHAAQLRRVRGVALGERIQHASSVCSPTTSPAWKRWGTSSPA